MVKKNLLYGLAAGILIGIGGTVFLACENKIMGAVLFSVALLCICLRGYALYTGKIGFIVLSHKKSDVSAVLLALLGNFIGTLVFGLAIRVANHSLEETAKAICEGKLGQSIPETLIRGIFCGILMYLAVIIYRENKTIVGILFCIPVFILSGFEHSIADMFYFSASGIVSLKAFGFLWLVIAGNTIGGMLLPLILKLADWKRKTADDGGQDE